MMAEIKSIGTLIDELITINLRCWHAQEQRNGESAQRLNGRRNHLVAAIDRVLKDPNAFHVSKTYENP